MYNYHTFNHNRYRINHNRHLIPVIYFFLAEAHEKLKSAVPILLLQNLFVLSAHYALLPSTRLGFLEHRLSHPVHNITSIFFTSILSLSFMTRSFSFHPGPAFTKPPSKRKDSAHDFDKFSTMAHLSSLEKKVTHFPSSFLLPRMEGLPELTGRFRQSYGGNAKLMQKSVTEW